MKLDNLNADEFQNAMCLLADVAEDVMNGELGAKAKASYAKFRSDSAKAKAKADAEAKAEALAIAEKLKSCQVKIAAKGGAGGKLFGAVTAKEISEQLKAQHDMELDSKKLVLAEPIKTFGSFEVKAKLGFEITGTVYVLVCEEK